MTPENFVYWLQGHCEMNPNTPPTQEQWEMIKDHLKTVFKKETKDFGDFTPEITKPVYEPPYSIPTPFTLPYDSKPPQIIC